MLPLLMAVAGLAAEPAPPDPSCADEVQSADVLARLEVATARYSDLDVDGFLEIVGEVEATLPCVRDPVTAHVAAELHRHFGLRSFLDRDPAASTAAFASARAIEPSYVFPATVVPAGNAVLDEYVAVDPAASPVEALPEPDDGWLRIDGRSTVERPTARPVVFQRFGDDGAVRETRYLRPGDAPPAYDVRPEPAAEPAAEPLAEVPPPATARPSRTLRTVLAVTAAATGGAALATWGGSHVVRGRYEATTDPAVAETLYQQTNTLVFVSTGAAVLSAGTGVGALLVARF